MCVHSFEFGTVEDSIDIREIIRADEPLSLLQLYMHLKVDSGLC